MDILTIRAKIDAGDFFIVDHALTEAFKDGISVNDIISCIRNGKIIESYPERKRCLIFSLLHRNYSGRKVAPSFIEGVYSE